MTPAIPDPVETPIQPAPEQAARQEAVDPAIEGDRRLKDWALRAPDGAEHRFRNLSAFLRRNANLFRPEDLASLTKAPTGLSRAYLGLSRLRPEHPEKRTQWRGWRWADPVPPRPPIVRKGGSWALRAPDGREHHFQNLSAFVSENAGLFDAAALAPYGDGQECRVTICLRQLRPRPGNRHKSWNGWRWLDP